MNNVVVGEDIILPRLYRSPLHIRLHPKQKSPMTRRVIGDFKFKFDNYFLWRETVMIVPSRSIVPVYSTFAGASKVARRSDSS